MGETQTENIQLIPLRWDTSDSERAPGQNLLGQVGQSEFVKDIIQNCLNLLTFFYILNLLVT